MGESGVRSFWVSTFRLLLLPLPFSPCSRRRSVPFCRSTLFFSRPRQQRRLCRQVRIILPPVQAYLLCLINRANQQTDANREQFHVGQRNSYIARDYQPFVENAVQNIYQVRRSRSCRHPIHKFSFLFAGKDANTRSARLMLNAAVTACQRAQRNWVAKEWAVKFTEVKIPSCWFVLPEMPWNLTSGTNAR